MSRHFTEVREINLSGNGHWKSVGLYFGRPEPTPPRDEEVERLRQSYETALSKLRLCAAHPEEFVPIFNQIKASAVATLATDGGQLSDGVDSLREISAGIVDISRTRRKYYLRQLIFGAVGSAVLSLSLWGLFVKVLSVPAPTWSLAAALAVPGAALGVVFIGFFANRSLTYEAAGQFDKYNFDRFERFMWVSLVSIVLLTALWNKALVLGSGSLILNDVVEHPSYGFLIGMIAGIGEASLAELLTSRLSPAEKEKQ